MESKIHTSLSSSTLQRQHSLIPSIPLSLRTLIGITSIITTTHCAHISQPSLLLTTTLLSNIINLAQMQTRLLNTIPQIICRTITRLDKGLSNPNIRIIVSEVLKDPFHMRTVVNLLKDRIIPGTPIDYSQTPVLFQPGHQGAIGRSSPDIRHHPITRLCSLLLMNLAVTIGRHNVLEESRSISCLGEPIRVRCKSSPNKSRSNCIEQYFIITNRHCRVSTHPGH